MKKLLITLSILVFYAGVFADGQSDVAITIYNNNLGLVKDVRELNFKKGVNFLDFDEVASQIDATSVNFRCLDDKNIAVYEQNYLYDLVSTESLLKRFIGKTIEVIGEDDRHYKGKLMSYDSNNIILRDTGGEVVMIALVKIIDYKFPSLEGLILKPTLRWEIESPSSGSKKCEVSYLTGGINWQADYVAVVSKDDNRLDISGWVTVNNTSGTAYNNAKLKLVAGDVHRVTERRGREFNMLHGSSMPKGSGRPQFEEESFFEYHLYTLNRPATLNDKEIKQLTLFPPARTAVKKVYIFDAQQQRRYSRSQDNKVKIKTNLEFDNSEKAGLGMPLPKGKLRVYKEDSQKALQFVGEDLIDHTPKDEKVRVYLGDAFDITGTRSIVDREELSREHYRESCEISLKNHKNEDIVVTVVEHPQGWREWKVVKSNMDYRKIDNYKIEFDIPVAADSEAKLTYTIKY